MKKLSYILTAACAVWALSSCSEDKEPVYHAPTPGSFSLYEPAMQDQYIELAEGGTLELVTSGQPDYGFSAVATYGALMSLTDDFSDPEKVYELTPVDNHQSKLTLNQLDVAIGVCDLLGLESEDDFVEAYPDKEMPYMPLYFKATCQLDGVADSFIETRVVSYKNIKPYFAVPTPGFIYMAGNLPGNNWNEPSESHAAEYANWRLFEPANAIGSKIYTGTFTLPEAPMFRFYTALTGWDADSYGYQEVDEATSFELVDGSWSGSMIKGKGAYSFPDFEGGEVTIIVDMVDPSAMTVTIMAGAVEVFVPNYIYMIGNFTADGGWKEPSEANAAYYEDYKLFNSKSAEAVFTGSIDVTDAIYNADSGTYDLYVRFAYELLGWDDGQWGIQAPDESVECSLTNNEFSSAYVKGKGSWEFKLTEPGKMDIAVDTDNETVVFNFIPGEQAESNLIISSGNC